jgi:LEA14-like dessication related protein
MISLSTRKQQLLPPRRRVSEARVFIFLCVIISSCVPKEPVEFRGVKNILLDTNISGEPLLTGQAIFYNPNHLRMKLKEVNVEVWINGKKSAQVDQKPDLAIQGNSEFSVSVVVKISLKEIGLLNTVLSLFGGKKYEIEYRGYVRIHVHGVTVKIPIRYKDEIRLKI